MQAVWLQGMLAGVEARLRAFFEAERVRAAAVSPEAGALIAALGELTLRGGKRLRALALYAGYCAVRDDFDPAPVLDAAAALELLQSYFLIQDDWMDGDEERRGGPAVHAALARAHGSAQLGASLAILASDLGSAAAWELIARAPFPPARLREALAAFGQMHFEVVAGQQLDLLAHADVALVHQLKTGSYTVRGPLKLGALLGDASAAQLAALDRFAAPLGLAFQLRDDLLGTFGDHTQVGKPIGNDLRAGKRTALVAEARTSLTDEQARALDRVLGNPGASDDELTAAMNALVACGARERLEARLQSLITEADAILTHAPLSQGGAAILRELAHNLVQRTR